MVLVRFDEGNLQEQIRLASDAVAGAVAGAQVTYLASYLAALKPPARTILVEQPYIDRHYLQEFVGYYSTSLRPPPSHATRLHFLAADINDAGWDDLLRRGVDSDDVQQKLQEDYLGYVVVRPVASCPVGRTVLRFYDDKASRCYAPAGTNHEVHLAGFKLQVAGMPFQQQDQGLGACATTAVWSALARVTRADGGRAVTPLDVAEAAHGGTSDLPLVASPMGLNLEETSAAVRAFGYVPHWLQPKDPSDPTIFLLAMKCYLRGGIPVILRYYVGGVLHAATVAGFRESDAAEPADDLVLKLGSRNLRVAGLSRLYVHDDRLGPYARVRFCPQQAGEPFKIRFDPRHPGLSEFNDECTVDGAIVPLYPKVRLSAEDIIAYAVDYLPLLQQIAGTDKREHLRLEPWISLGGDYLASISSVMKDSARVANVRRRALLSRYVGVLRFSLDSDWMLDFVLDTTDVKRNHRDAPPVILVTTSTDVIAAAVRDAVGASLVI